MGVYEWGRYPSGDYSRDRENLRDYSEKFWAKVTPGTSYIGVEAYPGCPRQYQPHPDDPKSYVDVVSMDRVNGRLIDVTVTYSSEVDVDEDKQRDNFNEDPLQRPAVVTLSSEREMRAVNLDVEGTPLQTTAGEPLTRERRFTLWRLNVKKNIATWPRWLLDYPNAINQDPVRIKGVTWPKHTLILDDVELGEESEENGVSFVTLSMKILYRQETWKDEFLNFGRYELVDEKNAAGEVVPVLKEILVGTPAAPVKKPIPIDENGRAYRDADGNIKLQVDPEEITKNILEFKLTDEKSFRKLPLQ